MWHWNHEDYRDQNFARQLIFSISKMGIRVFPSYDTSWHFDDKIGQKYLFEAIDAPIVPCYTFYDKVEAYKWIQETRFPKVFKLRGGAGSLNVRMVSSKAVARRLTRKAFGKGFPLKNNNSNFRQRLWVLRRDKNPKAAIYVLKGILRYVYRVLDPGLLPRQKGYIYFQDFIPANEFDDRVIVIGKKAIAIRRYNRKGDFRASGSGLIEHDPGVFGKETIRMAFDVAGRIGTDSLAFDFVYDETGKPRILEISYAYSMGSAYDRCPGYWDPNLDWHKDEVNPQRYIIEDFIREMPK
jgi:glutathione synthase/RimK-type ligase-like ATP-grasp enzyme